MRNKVSLQRLGVCILLAAFSGLTGCGKSAKQHNSEVEGVVHFNGTPLANARIEFVPISDNRVRMPSSSAMSDESGKFKLVCEDNKPGALVCKHRVIVIQGRVGENSHDRDDTDPSTKVPQAYSIASKTPLEVEVTVDKHRYEVSIWSKPPEPAP